MILSAKVQLFFEIHKFFLHIPKKSSKFAAANYVADDVVLASSDAECVLSEDLRAVQKVYTDER